MTTTFPLLAECWTESANDPLAEVLRRLNLLGPGERICGVARAGEGNMNLTLRVATTSGTLIVKQARPWVEKYPSIPAPVERTAVEHAFYRAVAGLPGVAGMMPRVLAFDPDMHVLVLEDLGSLMDLTAVYRGVRLPDAAIGDLAGYLAALHAGTRGKAGSFPANAAMRLLNHEHIFVVPLDPRNGLDLDAHEPGLRAAAAPLLADPHVRDRFTALGARYLSPGAVAGRTCLIHGDYYPGSWVESSLGVRIIDPEFAFAGDAEFDIGVALAHFRIADESGDSARRWLAASLEAHDRACGGRGDAAPLDPRLIVETAAIEIIRRLLGVAQLPLPRSHGRRAALLESARRALHEPFLKPLE